MRRDRLTFAMMVGVPIMQLVLFGYAINTDPQAPADRRGLGRRHERLHPHHGRGAAEHRLLRLRPQRPRAQAEADAAAAARRGAVRRHHPVRLHAPSWCAASAPQMLVEADATDPAATGNAIAALRQPASDQALRARPEGPLADAAAERRAVELRVHRRYNPEGITALQHRARPARLILTMTMVMMTALALTRERERGTMENLLAMPVTPARGDDRQDRCPTSASGCVQVGGDPAARRCCCSTCRWSAASLAAGARPAAVHRRQPRARLHVLDAGRRTSCRRCR